MTDPVTGRPQPTDEVLLDRLTEALRPPPLAPPPASVAVLLRAVEQKWKPTARARVIRNLAAWARRLLRIGGAVAVLGGAVAATEMALAAGRSIPHPVQHGPHHRGIPVPSPTAQQNSSGGSANASVKVIPGATALPARTTASRHSARPLSTAATGWPLSTPAQPTRYGASGLSSVVTASYRRPLLAGSGRSTPATGQTPTGGTPGAYGGASLPARHTAGPTGLTTPTAWTGVATTGSWWLDNGWSHTSGGGFATTGRTASTSWARSSDPRSRAASPGDAAYGPTTRDPAPSFSRHSRR